MDKQPTSTDKRHNNPGRPLSATLTPLCKSCGAVTRPNGSSGGVRLYKCPVCGKSGRYRVEGADTPKPAHRPRTAATTYPCPYCNSKARPNGSANGKKRYRCETCRKNFTAPSS